MRSLYRPTRANTIIRKLSHAIRWRTKLMLFRSYWTSFNRRQLWSPMFPHSYSKPRVAYNDALRHLLQETWCCSAPGLFVFNNVPSFAATVRNLVFSYWRSLRHCDNILCWCILSAEPLPNTYERLQMTHRELPQLSSAYDRIQRTARH